jgi:hypothetical protein
MQLAAMEHLPEGLSFSALCMQKHVLCKEHEDDVIWKKGVPLKAFHCGLETGSTLIGTKLRCYKIAVIHSLSLPNCQVRT